MTKKGDGKSKKADKAAKPKKAKQLDLAAEGMARKTIKAIDEAAEALREVRAERISKGAEELKLQSSLLSVMKEHGVSVYKYIDGEGEEMLAELDDVTKVKVRKAKKPKPAKAAESTYEGGE